MKKTKIVLYVLLIVILSFSTYGQTEFKEVTKIAFKKLPTKVKNQVNEMKGFKIIQSTYVIENNKKIYTVQITNGKSEYDLKLDKNGKILGREEDYL